jgi:hypothetical protein
MSVRRRAICAWLGSLLMWAIVLGLVFIDHAPVHSVWAQDAKPTAPPQEQPTKPPIEPQPTKEQIPPTAVPSTKEPLPTMAPTRAPTKTPWPTPPTGVPTKTSFPTALPTKTPLPTSPTATTATGTAAGAIPSSSATITPFSQSEANRAVAQPSMVTAMPSFVPVAALATVSGMVFDDRNDNGQRDPDEPGLAGVAVSVVTAGELKTTVTDAQGVYTLPTLAGATVRISVPAGWNTRQAESRPSEHAGDFPLRANQVAESRQPAALTPLTITQSVIDFAPLIALGIGLGVIMAFGFLRTARAVSTSNRALALLLVRMQRTSERPLTFESGEPNRATEARMLTLLNQAGLDAVGRSLKIERVLTLSAGDRPAITALGHDGRAAFVVLTPLEAKAFQRAWRAAPTSSGEVAFERAEAYPLEQLCEVLATGHAAAYPLDALNSGLFVADDLAAAYAYLAAELPVSARTLPRTARWTLFIVPLPKNDLTVRSRWRLWHR